MNTSLMHSPGVLLISAVVLAAGTYAFRLAGPMLRSRLTFPPHVERLMETSAIVLLASLVATTGLMEGHGMAGVARPAGVAVAGVLAWRKAPFLVVVIGAAAVTALLRLAGVE
ncbi:MULTISPECIES: AzlD domain-containing protein [unclassified Streptomyces]|uniref:AzlD domain-containing protein n=1 Tax=unclassified Streptomyces TaxID=2593676 RepID=UPI00278C1BF1|nr:MULTISPECIES: AzlD domain-containing protein [unclassified Streptomyces]